MNLAVPTTLMVWWALLIRIGVLSRTATPSCRYSAGFAVNSTNQKTGLSALSILLETGTLLDESRNELHVHACSLARLGYIRLKGLSCLIVPLDRVAGKLPLRHVETGPTPYRGSYLILIHIYKQLPLRSSSLLLQL